MATNEKHLPSPDAHEQILEMEERIDEELSKGEQADMHLTNAYFRRIRELDGGVYEKSEEEVSRELKALYAKARTRFPVLASAQPINLKPSASKFRSLISLTAFRVPSTLYVNTSVAIASVPLYA